MRSTGSWRDFFPARLARLGRRHDHPGITMMREKSTPSTWYA